MRLSLIHIFPNMYRVTTELVGEGGKVLDRAENPLGFRTLELTADRGMLINGCLLYTSTGASSARLFAAVYLNFTLGR